MVLKLEKFLGNFENHRDSKVVNLEKLWNSKVLKFFWGGMTGAEMTGNRQSLRGYRNEGFWWENIVIFVAICVILGTFHFVINSCLKLYLILERFLKILKNDRDSKLVNLEMM